jgi:hypothetical protein
MARKTLGVFLVMAAVGLITTGVFGMSNGGPVVFKSFLAQVGVAVGIAPNPYNTLNDQLNAKQSQIDAEQANLNAEQAGMASTTAAGASPAATSPLIGYLIIAVGILALLVGLNFYFDWHRSHLQLPTQS